MESLNGVVLLSKGGTWKPRPVEAPFLRPKNNSLTAWPDDATATIIFTDTAGDEILTLDGDVEPDTINFLGEPDDMDTIPAGANFTIILEYEEGTFPIRYGKVIRKEVAYTTPPSQQGVTPLTIADNLQRTALGRKWIAVNSSAQMVDNGPSLPVGWCPSNTSDAYRYVQEFATDGIEIGVTLLNPNPTTSAWISLDFCTDINMEMGIAVKFETGSTPNQKIHVGTLNGDPLTITDQVANQPNLVNNLDYYLIRYVPSTKTVVVYKNTGGNPLIVWVDNAGLVPHGGGYRHVGWSQVRTNTSQSGIQITSITARDAA